MSWQIIDFFYYLVNPLKIIGEKVMLKKLTYVLTLLVMTLFLQNCKNECSHETENLDVSKKNIANYYESGLYETDLDKALEPAYEALKKSYNKNAAIIFDVDETILSNYNYIKSINFGYESDLWNIYLKEGSADPIDKTVEFYKKAVESGLSVIFLTARTSESCEHTYDNLISSGITEFDTLICKGPEFEGLPSQQFKETERRLLTEAGYDIVMCVGDQPTDLAGENTGVKIKLPNKLYITK